MRDPGGELSHGFQLLRLAELTLQHVSLRGVGTDDQYFGQVFIGHVNPRQINDLGMASVLSGRVLFALVLLTTSFCLLLHRRPLNVPVAVLHLGILIFMLYGMTTFIEEVPRFAVSWRHAGVADFHAPSLTAALHAAQLLFSLACLPYESWFHVDAIVRTHWRMLFSRRRLLEWMPSSERAISSVIRSASRGESSERMRRRRSPERKYSMTR